MTKRRKSLPALFLDRDGTLIQEAKYLNDARLVKLLPGVASSLRRLKRAGFTLVVTSNQSGVGRGLITPTQLEAVRARFFQVLAQHKVSVDGYYWCPHLPSAKCTCRKPKSGMLRKAGRALKVSWRGGISIGDRPSDVQLGQKAQGWGILVLSGYGREYAKQWEGPKPDYTAKNFKAAADWILRRVRKDGSWMISEH